MRLPEMPCMEMAASLLCTTSYHGCAWRQPALRAVHLLEVNIHTDSPSWSLFLPPAYACQVVRGNCLMSVLCEGASSCTTSLRCPDTQPASSYF
eukprot:6200292-Pleurochrysis_carterae.AAC.2